MVDANIVISVSAVLVALVLTLVIILRLDGDPDDNFSMNFKGSYTAEGSTYASEMYYCTGESCRFFDMLGPEDSFPGYFALVGFVDSETGDKFLTEHSIGQTFVFDSGNNLKSCHPSETLDTIALGAVVDSLSGAWDSDSKSFSMDGVTFVLSDHSLDTDPSDDEPKVLGISIPSADACRVANGETLDVVSDLDCADCVNANDARFLVENQEPVEVAAPEQGVRHLISGSVFASLASFGYDGAKSLPGGWSHVKSCVNGNAVGRVAQSGGIKVVSFAGTNDFKDVIQDLKTWGHSTYHGGFYDYTMMLKGCIDSNGGQSANYIVGHSLGGATATIYKQLSNAAGTVVTFGAPKTTKGRSCTVTGVRIFNEKDPVASNGMGILGSFNHDVKTSKKAFVRSGGCKKRFWGVCYSYHSDSYEITGGACGEQAGGCSWLADCIYNVGRHSLDTYKKHSLGSINI